jgi:autophagy-related protein 2
VVEISVPSFSASLTKDTLDGLQLWADDMAQWADRAFSGKASTEGSMVTTSQATSRGQSTIIGSRYFVQRTASNVGEEEEIHRSDLVIKMGIDDGMCYLDRGFGDANYFSIANVQLCMKRGEGDVRPFDIIASDIQTTVQVKPEGRVSGSPTVFAVH